uniref:RRM domain-containing protein n=1 Tax=Anopheles farauti TaxID=69004 RepID=A0A182QJL4_9DIPT
MAAPTQAPCTEAAKTMSVIIRLQNLPLAANASDVRNFFKGLAIPDGGVHIVGGALGDAFIAFSTDEDARQAMSLNGGCIKNEPISLLLSSRAEMQKVIDQARKAALTYMQLKQSAPPLPQLNRVDGVGSTVLPKQQQQQLQQQPQPPVISLAGFLAKAQSTAVLTTNITTATVPAAAVKVPTLSPLLTQGSSYNEIPGLSFLSSDAGGAAATAAGVITTGATGTTSLIAGAGPAVNNGALSEWLTVLNGAQNLNGVAPIKPQNVAAPPPIGLDNQTPWKFLKKDRRSRSRSRERSYRRSSRSSSRERDNDDRRRSRSSSRDRGFKRDGRSRSSSRDRNGRRWSRSSSREYNRRYGNSRSRSSSRDRFGRTRERSRSRSRDRRSRDSSYDRNVPGGRTRVSRFSNRNDHDFNGQQQQQQHQLQQQLGTMNRFGVGAGIGPLNHAVNSEPIFGLHTTPLDQQQRSRSGSHFSTRSGKISPPMVGGNGSAFGGPFRNTSPLPDSVYGGTKTTSDYAVKVSNLEPSTGYGEIRRFFKQYLISTQGIKMINDQYGRRSGVAYIQFLRKEGKQGALKSDGTMLRRNRIVVESITDQAFESAIDSYRPGSTTTDRMMQSQGMWDDQYQQQQQQQQHQQQQQYQQPRVNPWNTNPPTNADVIEIPDDHDDSNRDGGGGSGRMLHQHPPTSALMVWNLPTYTTEQDIMKMFSDFTVVEVLIVKNHQSPKQLDGYVRFHRQEDAKEAWSQLHRHYIGNKKVTVRMCQEIDYEVAKNEYENPRDAAAASAAVALAVVGQSSPAQRDELTERQHNLAENGQRNAGGQEKSSNSGGHNNAAPAAVRSSRWDSVERNWDDPEENEPQQQVRAPPQSTVGSPLDSDAAVGGGDTNGSWTSSRDPRMNRAESETNSQTNDSSSNHWNGGNDSNNSNSNNNIGNDMNNHTQNGNSRDPRKPGGRFGGSRFGPNPVNDNSEMFTRTNWLLLRNVDFNVYEEDVFGFFGQDGFHARNVLLVRNERGGRTGECLVEFGSPSEAAHAESKSSQNLGRRKVFASHLDRGQVADLMTRFNAIAQGLQPSYWLPDHLRNDGNGGGNGNGNGGRGGGNNGGSDGGDLRDDPEANQGTGCGPYRTSTVGLLNLAYKTTIEDVQNFFQEFNLPPENIRRRFLDNGQSTGEAMVRFRCHQDAEKALNEYQNRRLFGRNVRIRLINDD